MSILYVSLIKPRYAIIRSRHGEQGTFGDWSWAWGTCENDENEIRCGVKL